MCKMRNIKGMLYFLCLDKLENKVFIERKFKEKEYLDMLVVILYFKNIKEMLLKFDLDVGVVG